jgi:hypothetical protein
VVGKGTTPLPGVPAVAVVGWTDTYDLTGADVLQAIDWAQRPAGDGLTYAVALVEDDDTPAERRPGRARGLVWLVGGDGNDYPPTLCRHISGSGCSRTGTNR